MSEQAERFIKIEKAAQETVTMLEGLKNESESYKTASKHLEAGGQKVAQVGDMLLKAANESMETSRILRSVGPEIKEDVKKVSNALAELMETHNQDTKKIYLFLYVSLGVSFVTLVLLILQYIK